MIRYHWEVDEYSQYRTVTSIVSLVGMTVCIPLLNKLSINEAYILLGVFTSSLARNVIKGLASKPWMYYLGKIRVSGYQQLSSVYALFCSVLFTVNFL